MKADEMKTKRKTAIIVGILYIIGTVAGILSVVFTQPFLYGPDYLIQVSANQNQIVLGALFVLTMGLALAMIPVLLFPILKKHNETLALGFLIFRGALETVTAIALVITWLFLLTLSGEYVATAGVDVSSFQTLGAVFLKGTDSISAIMGIVFSLGALMLYYMFYRSKLVPGWISIWGFIAIVLHLATCILILFHLQSPSSTINSVMNFPIFSQEMVMAGWLIAKGFKPSAIASLTSQADVN
jgi:hypothetical protein